MVKHRIIIDCDPGIDDAIALLMALASPDEIELLGVTTVAGNKPLDVSTRNALKIAGLAGAGTIPIHAGCERAILQTLAPSASSHGADGLGDIGLVVEPAILQPGHAVDFIIDTILREPGQVTLCLIGPMTNLALALIKAPAIAPKIREVLFMGGAAFVPGNTTPEAEFNIWYDPHAAQVVMSSGIRLTMFGLDVTNQARMSPEWLTSLAVPDQPPVVQAAISMMHQYLVGDPCLHDPCVIAYLLAPGLFDGTDARVEVELVSRLTLGKTVATAAPLLRKGQSTNCHVVTRVDVGGFFDLLAERLGRLSAPK